MSIQSEEEQALLTGKGGDMVVMKKGLYLALLAADRGIVLAEASV
ncbi:hypothetical protein ZBT109_0087 [Zymobacter palmae]|uniref:Uncharacterized protein n=1 Tax=Zymobacter palmae TaxID=33074 RepID=A0A348HB85_9GAMM|nr:hypothetical protein ZBT109_0087 [Zymobacter palmae]